MLVIVLSQRTGTTPQSIPRAELECTTYILLGSIYFTASFRTYNTSSYIHNRVRNNSFVLHALSVWYCRTIHTLRNRIYPVLYVHMYIHIYIELA